MDQQISITKLLSFDAGHRLLAHPGKCSSLHGHRYTAEITVTAASLDKLGMVIDFGKVKELVGGWIDANWDHTMILHMDDPLLFHPRLFGPRRPYIMASNPTAENMAAELLEVAGRLLGEQGMLVEQVKLWETPNCFSLCRKSEAPRNAIGAILSPAEQSDPIQLPILGSDAGNGTLGPITPNPVQYEPAKSGDIPELSDEPF